MKVMKGDDECDEFIGLIMNFNFLSFHICLISLELDQMGKYYLWFETNFEVTHSLKFATF